MVRDAEMHAGEDETKRGIVKVRNEAEVLIYSAEQTLKDHGDNVSADDRQMIEESLKSLKELVATGDAEPDDIRRAIERLSVAVYKIAELMYNATANKDFNGAK